MNKLIIFKQVTVVNETCFRSLFRCVSISMARCVNDLSMLKKYCRISRYFKNLSMSQKQCEKYGIDASMSNFWTFSRISQSAYQFCLKKSQRSPFFTFLCQIQVLQETFRRPLGDQLLSKRRLSNILDQSFFYSFFFNSFFEITHKILSICYNTK